MISCVFVGPFKDKRLGQIAEEFRSRLDRLWPVNVTEVAGDKASLSRFVEKKRGKSDLYSMDAHGSSMDSASFTGWVTSSSRDITFLGWDSDGPPPGLDRTGMKSISLSPMTYSHEIARVLLLEQLYRAGATLKGHPYPR